MSPCVAGGRAQHVAPLQAACLQRLPLAQRGVLELAHGLGDRYSLDRQALPWSWRRMKPTGVRAFPAHSGHRRGVAIGPPCETKMTSLFDGPGGLAYRLDSGRGVLELHRYRRPRVPARWCRPPSGPCAR